MKRFSALLVGCVFFIAGLLKLMDPLGSSLIVEAYFNFLHLGFLKATSMVVGDAFALAETILGTALITGVWRRITGIASGIFLAFFTLLTLGLWIFNPAMDCGCFGQAIHLEHWQSFVKNIVLDLMWIIAFVPIKNDKPLKSKYAAFAIAVVSVCAFLAYSSLSIPMLDFTPYAPGAEISESENNLSFYNSQWEYADSLATSGKVMINSIYNPEKFDSDDWQKVSAFADSVKSSGLKHLILTAASPDSREGVPDSLNIFYADRRTLMTLNRSNGGASMLSDGQMISKWSFRGLPTRGKMTEMSDLQSLDSSIKENTPRRLWLQGFLLYVFAVMLLL